MARTFQNQFPTFVVCSEVVQLLAAGFSDMSWRNDACPSFESPDHARRVFVDYADPQQRDTPEQERFLVTQQDEHGEYGSTLLTTDAWPEVCRLLGLPVPTALQRLACHFSLCLLEDLGPERLQAVREENRTTGNDQTDMYCASGDHCDSNMTMERAFVQTFGRTPCMGSDVEEGDCTEAQSDADLDAWNRAWTHAKRLGFDAAACLRAA